MVETVEELNKQWKDHIMENRLLLLLEVGEKMLDFIQGFRFDVPHYWRTDEKPEERFAYMDSWEVVLMHDTLEELNDYFSDRPDVLVLQKSTAFRIGCYESVRWDKGMTKYVTEWLVNATRTGTVNVSGDTISEHLFYIHDEKLIKLLENLLQDFKLKEKIEELVTTNA